MKFVTIQKQALLPKQTNINSKAYYDLEHQQVLETVDIQSLKETLRIPVQSININTSKYLTETLLSTITPSYLRGSVITINGVKFKPCTANPQYFFSWTEAIPSKLPEHLKQAYKTYSLRGALYQELVEWNQRRIQKAAEASKFKWDLAEEFYKDVYKTFATQLKVQSPNKKTFFEANAELNFEAWCPQAPALTEDEKRNISIIDSRRYSAAFGLQSIELQISYRHRTTKHGTTEEITLISDNDISNATASNAYIRHTGQQYEGYIDDEGFEVFTWLQKSKSTVISNTRVRENIQTIKWMLSLPQDQQKELLLPGWHFCPVCNSLYHETEGCYAFDGYGNEIAHVEEVSFIPYNENHEGDA